MTTSHNHSPLVIRILQNFRQALLAREDAQLTRMAREWLRIEASLQDDMFVLAQQIEYAKEHGAVVTEQLIAKQEKYQILEAQLQEQILRYANNVAVPDISREQVAYAEHGVKGAVDAIKASYINVVPTFNTLSVDAFTDMVGMLGDGTPLYRLLKEAYPDALDGIVKALLQGVARGIGPNQTALEMSKGMGLGLERITLIARTEQLRVWRVAIAKQYQESGVVVESRRLCMKDERTCMACLMSDGEVIPIDKVLHDHPRGRCTSVPVVKGAPPITWELGKDWFLKQHENLQREVLGPKMFDLWKERGFNLTKLVGVAESKVWGDSPRPKTLEEMKNA